MMRTVVGAGLSGIALLVSGCAGDSQAQVDETPSLGSARALVLRTVVTGGIGGLGGPGAMPGFSLYGDGTAIAGRTQPTEYRLTTQALRRLVAAASEARLGTPRTVDNPNIADATYTVITFVTGGRARVTKIINEGHADDPAKGFLRRLDPATWPRGDQTTDPRPYHPRRVAVLSYPAANTGTDPAPKWPLRPLTTGTHVGAATCSVLTGADVARVERAAERPVWQDHGRSFHVGVRLLLPDEPNCAALNR